MKRHLALTLSVIITALSFSPAIVTAQSTAEIEKVRARVQTLSTSKDSQVEVKFRDRTKIKGYIDRVEPLSFTLRNAKDGTSQSITYSEVESVSKAGGGVSTSARRSVARPQAARRRALRVVHIPVAPAPALPTNCRRRCS